LTLPLFSTSLRARDLLHALRVFADDSRFSGCRSAPSRLRASTAGPVF
jgi:hypothetical protein